MRRYRGLTKEGKWVYGWYLLSNDRHYIVDCCGVTGTALVLAHTLSDLPGYHEVIPETVGQFVKVVQGKEIWEGDLLTGHRLPKRDPFLVEWDDSIAAFRMPYSYNEKELEIIGNKAQSPKLLEQDNG